MSNRGLLGLPQGQRSGVAKTSLRSTVEPLLTTITSANNAFDVEYVPTVDRIYVTSNNSSSGSYYVINPNTNTIVATVSTTEAYCKAITYVPGTTERVWTSQQALSGTVRGFDVATNSNTISPYAGSGEPEGLLYVPSVDRVYLVLAAATASIQAYVPSTGALVTSLSLGGGSSKATRAAYAPTSDRIYVAVNGGGVQGLAVINPNTNTYVTLIAGGAPNDVVYVPSVDRIYMINTTGTVTIVNPNTNAIVNTVTIGANLQFGKYVSFADRIYLTTNVASPNRLFAFDPVTNTVVSSYSTAGTTQARVGFASSTQNIYWTHQSANNVLAMLPFKETRYVY